MPRPLKFTKLHFIALFLSITGMLSIVRCVNPNIAYNHNSKHNVLPISDTTNNVPSYDLTPTTSTIDNLADLEITPSELEAPTLTEISTNEDFTQNTIDTAATTPKPAIKNSRIARHSIVVDSIFLRERRPLTIMDEKGQRIRNRIVSVRSYHHCFNDLNDVQLATAQAIGINRIEDRKEAAKRIDGLVFVGDNPYYGVKELTHSIPYLVPRAAICLEEIARAFIDSCVTKGVPTHKIVLTSVLRTEKDVRRLRRVNLNASENSCHQYGTTFDISYNHFIPIETNRGNTTSSTRLKQILAEVLEDQHLLGTCYIKYEHLRSACFHITAR